jgi:hypothetical protein
MRSKYLIPAVTGLASLLAWAVLLVLHAAGTSASATGLELGLCVASAGLMVVSAVRCRQVNGPRAGNVARFVLLFVMAAVVAWTLGAADGAVLAGAALVPGVLALTTPGSRPRTRDAGHGRPA